MSTGESNAVVVQLYTSNFEFSASGIYILLLKYIGCPNPVLVFVSSAALESVTIYILLRLVVTIAALASTKDAMPKILPDTATVATTAKLFVASSFHAHPSPAAQTYLVPS